jgi:Flp pilus assembly protein TadG
MHPAGFGPLTRFWRDRRGNVAMIFAIALPALAAMVGFGVDLHRGANAKASAQEAADAAVLSAASSRELSIAGLQRVAATYLAGNLDHRYLNKDIETRFERPTETEFKVTLTGSVNTFFMGLVGITSMPVSVTATAVRGAADRVELALVLDNTWSMSEQDNRGTRRIDALKTASRTLVNELMQRPDGAVRIAVVPYADYVNVGTANRNRSWVSVPADQSTTSPRVCRTNTTRRQCTRGAPRTCTRSVDGVTESYDCTPSTCKDVPSAPYESCSGGGTTTQRWHGCVGSRQQGMLRLSDAQPGFPYPGILASSQNCLTPITPLTDRKPTVLSAIDNLIVNVGSYRPLTHIPSGLIWGVNVLTPGEPFTDGLAHHESNRDPRKILVLMTDGANTLRFVPSSGEHRPFSTSGNSGKVQLAATDADTAAICDYAKSLKIEVFTVALAVDSGAARDLLQKCATSADHYFDARDTTALSEAFAAIAASVNRVRLVR